MSPAGRDRRVMARYRDLSALTTMAAVRARFAGWNDDTAAAMEAFATARHLLDEMAAIIERMDGPVVSAAAWCKGCGHATSSVPCGWCSGPACSACGRCPACDGEITEDGHG